MDVKLTNVSVGELTDGYLDRKEDGIVGYGGRLNIRPKYQREFVYKDKQRDAVVESVMKDFPLNTMYWGVADKDNDYEYELIDGQQRTISLCRYVSGGFAVGGKLFSNLPKDKQSHILDYKLTIYICDGTESERLDWFNVINIAGVPLTPQELRNAVYAGPWLQDAKKYFSRTKCPAQQIADKYVAGKPIQQELLEVALKWYSRSQGKTIEEVMASNQKSTTAVKLWQYFQNVIAWVASIFNKDGNDRRMLRGVDWGLLYDKYNEDDIDPAEVGKTVDALILDDDVTNKRGVYAYALSKDEHHLNIRSFTPAQRQAAYDRQSGVCPLCESEGIGAKHDMDAMEADHITPWSKGGKTETSNCQMLCKKHNRRKGAN